MHRPRPQLAWIAAGGLLALVIAAVAMVAGDRGAQAGLSSRFDTRGQLASEFASQYLLQVAARERRVARERFRGAVDPEAFAEMVTGQGFVAAVLLDASGNALQVHPPSPELRGRNLAARYRHLAQALDGELAVSDVVPSAVAAEPIVAVAVPFDTPSGRRVLSSGFAIGETPLDAFVRSSVPIRDSQAHLVDGTGYVISSSNDEVVGAQLEERLPGLARTRGVGSGPVDLDGVASHYVSVAVPDTAWRIILTVPHDSLYSPLADTRRVQVTALAVLAAVVASLVLLALRLVRTERRLFQKVSELEAANETLDTFSNTLVHDLRNPLAAIGGLAQTLRRVLSGADEQVRQITGHIETSAQRMDGLIGDVLSLATVTRSIHRSRCDPRELLLEASEDLAGLELDMGWLPDEVYADRSSLYRCFHNLFENACTHAAEADGVARVRVECEESPWSWAFSFEDGGPGVHPDDHQRIFTAFERGTGAAKDTGTGLGLSIVAACAKAHGGRVQLARAPGGGARFLVEIGKPVETPGPSFGRAGSAGADAGR